MPKERAANPLQASLSRARARWLNSAMINAGGRWAILPAVVTALTGLALALTGYRDMLPFALLCLLALCVIAAVLLSTRQVYSEPRRRGAPDWVVHLDRALSLDEALVTLLDGAGPFSGAVEARVLARLDEKRARMAAPRRHWGGLLSALLLALLPMAFWSPTASPFEEQSARADAGQDPAVQPKSRDDAPGSSSQAGPRGEKAGKQKQGGANSGAADGETKATQPAPSARAADKPGDPPPDDVRPEPAPSNSHAPKVGDNKGPKPPDQTPPGKQPDSVERAITPEVGEGERRTRETSRYVYDPEGDRRPGSDTRAPDWKERAEDAIPRMKLTSRERKLLEEWFNKIGR